MSGRLGSHSTPQRKHLELGDKNTGNITVLESFWPLKFMYEQETVFLKEIRLLIIHLLGQVYANGSEFD